MTPSPLTSELDPIERLLEILGSVLYGIRQRENFVPPTDGPIREYEFTLTIRF